jgi:hypothetical protein
VTEALDQRPDVVRGERRRWTAPAELLLGRPALGLDLADPPGDDCRVGPCLKRLAVAREARVTVRKDPPRCVRAAFIFLGRLLSLSERPISLVQPVRLEGSGDPSVERRDDLGLPDVHGWRMLGAGRERVLQGVTALVVGLVVVPAPLHLGSHSPPPKQATQQVGPGRPAGACGSWCVRSRPVVRTSSTTPDTRSTPWWTTSRVWVGSSSSPAAPHGSTTRSSSRPRASGSTIRSSTRPLRVRRRGSVGTTYEGDEQVRRRWRAS